MPPSSSLAYARMKFEAGAALAKTIPETVATNGFINANTGRIYIDIGRSNVRKSGRSATEIGTELRAKMARLVGAEYTVLDDLSNGAQKPVQIRFHGTDSRRLLAITNDFMDKLRQVKGAVDIGLSEQAPQQELRIDLDRGLANSMGVSVNDAAQSLRVAFAGVEAGDWVDPTGEARDVAVRLAPEDRVDAEQHRAPADRRGRHRPHGAAGADRHRHDGQGAVQDPARELQAHGGGHCQRARAARRARSRPTRSRSPRPSRSRRATASSSRARRRASRRCSATWASR